MPTSATGISTSTRSNGLSAPRAGLQSRPPRCPRRSNAPRRSRGFSLLELLVVVTIIGIFAGAAILSLGVLGDDREIEHEARRLKSLLDLIHEEAVMQSRDFGVLFGEDGYRFYIYDYTQAKWVEPVDDKLFMSHELKTPLSLSLELEDRALVLDTPKDEKKDAAEEPEPQVVILSSGEMTPFHAEIRRDAAGGRFTLTAGLDGKIEITEDGFDKRR